MYQLAQLLLQNLCKTCDQPAIPMSISIDTVQESDALETPSVSPLYSSPVWGLLQLSPQKSLVKSVFFSNFLVKSPNDLDELHVDRRPFFSLFGAVCGTPQPDPGDRASEICSFGRNHMHAVDVITMNEDTTELEGMYMFQLGKSV